MVKTLSKLNNARKGSFGEYFIHQSKLFPTLEKTHREQTDFKQGDTVYDIKFHKHKPKPNLDHITYVWVKLEADCVKVIEVRKGQEDKQIGIFNLSFFEQCFVEWENRGFRKVLIDPPVRTVMENVAVLYRRKDTRVLTRTHLSVYGNVTVRPSIHPDSDKVFNKFKKTVLLVFSNDGKKLLEIWKYNHSDYNKLKHLLEPDGRGKFRFNPKLFPNKEIVKS
jgi:hypothetical protein